MWERVVLDNAIASWTSRLRNNGKRRGLKRTNEVVNFVGLERSKISTLFDFGLNNGQELLLIGNNGLFVRRRLRDTNIRNIEKKTTTETVGNMRVSVDESCLNELGFPHIRLVG